MTGKGRGMRTMGVRLGLVGLLLVTAVGCESDPEVKRVVFNELAPPPPGPVQADPHRLLSGDVVNVRFVHNPELNTEAPVGHDGKLAMPLIGDLPAAGMTIAELRADLSRRYKAFLTETSYGELLKEGDDLDLRFVYQPELNLGVRIRSDGKISLPLLGDVQAAGLTPTKLRDDLGARYGRHIKHPDVAVLVGATTAKKVFADEAYLMVTIHRLAPQTVYVGGEVKSPRVVPYDGQITTWQAIMQAGSFTDEADLAHVVILRRGQFDQGAWIRTNLDMPLGGERFPNDLILRAGDVVIVPKSGIAKWDLWVKQYIRDALPVQTYLSIFLIPYQAKPQ